MRVLVTDIVHPLFNERLSNAGYDIDYLPGTDQEFVQKNIHRYHGIVINSKINLDRSIEFLGDLSFAGRMGSGKDVFDMVYMKEHNIRVYTSPEGNCRSVGEHALGMLLSLARNISRGDRQVREKKWYRDMNRGFEISGKTVGLIGYGHTGKEFCSALKGFNVKCLIYDPYINIKEHEYCIQKNELEDLLKEAEIISFHVHLTQETYHMADRDFFNICNEGVIIINTSRGKVINTSALIEALKNGKVGGVCLDVLEKENVNELQGEEKKNFEKLSNMGNALFTPHIAGWTIESRLKIAEVLSGKILKGESGIAGSH